MVFATSYPRIHTLQGSAFEVAGYSAVTPTNVCSLHFRESEIRKGLGGRKMSVDVHHRSSFEICMAHFTAKETAAVCKIFIEEEQASSGRII